MSDVRGLLADENAGGMLVRLRERLIDLKLWPLLVGEGLAFVTFEDLELPPAFPDRALWRTCQAEGWALLTDNRNADGPDSLQATIADSWTAGDLPVVTVGDKRRFERDRDYAETVAADVADILYGLTVGDYRYAPRHFVPLDQAARPG